MLDGKADGCSQWFLSCLAYEKPTARRVGSFEFSSETTSNKESKLDIELWAGTQINLEIFCADIYADDDQTMIL